MRIFVSGNYLSFIIIIYNLLKRETKSGPKSSTLRFPSKKTVLCIGDIFTSLEAILILNLGQLSNSGILHPQSFSYFETFWCAIITYKHGIYKLLDEPNNLSLRFPLAPPDVVRCPTQKPKPVSNTPRMTASQLSSQKKKQKITESVKFLILYPTRFQFHILYSMKPR